MRFSVALVTCFLAACSPLQASADTARCDDIGSRIEFCQDGAWMRFGEPADGLATWRNEDGLVAKLIYETASDSDMLTTAMMETAILSLVSSQIPDPDGIDVRSMSGGILSGRLVGTLVYTLSPDNEDVLAHHSYMVDDGLVIQFITFSPAAENESADAAHRQFLSGFSIDPPSVSL